MSMIRSLPGKVLGMLGVGRLFAPRSRPARVGRSVVQKSTILDSAMKAYSVEPDNINRARGRSKYEPHQGAGEKRRRARQVQRGIRRAWTPPVVGESVVG